MRRWLIVLVPALITALATLAPAIIEFYSKSSGDLQFETVSGPSVKSDSEHRRIVSIYIRNAGRNKLTNVRMWISTKTDKILNFSTGDELKVIGSLQSNSNEITLNAAHMLENDHFSVSLLLSSVSASSIPSISLRSDETLGYEKTQRESNNESKSLLTPLIISTSFAMLFTTMFGLIFLRFFNNVISRRSQIFFALNLFDIDNIDIELISKDNFSFFEFGSYMLSSSISKTPTERQESAKCLMVVLLEEKIHPESRKYIEDAIDILSPSASNSRTFTALREKSKKIKTASDFWKSAIEIKNLSNSA